MRTADIVRERKLAELLERRIDAAFRGIVTATTRADRIAAMESLRGLVKQRSAEQIERMEGAKGLVRASKGGGRR
ncbi:MAG: hypothetical protein ACP5P4_15090 [Steroidobacteraceae bacterium]